MQEDKTKKTIKSKKVGIASRNWYQDKAFGITLQRNILFIISIILFASVIFSLVTIKSIVEKNSVEPYVIKVSKQDQIPVSIDIESIRQFASANQGVVEYFLLLYVRSKESYNFETYPHDYNTVVKRMSANSVFNPFWAEVNAQEGGIINTLGKNGKIDIVIKQLALESRNNIAVIRIAKRLIQNGNIKQVNHFKIKMHYLFDTSNLSYKDIVLNPLGLKVDFYEMIEEKAFVNDETFNKII
jgi:type IV secretory pathway component VirB8